MNRKHDLNRMGIAPALAVLALLGAGTGTTVGAPVAVDSTIGDSISPSHPLYGVERVGENIKLSVTTSEVGKAKARIAMASERIDEAVVEAQLGNAQYVEELTDEYGAEISSLAENLRAAKFGELEGVTFKDQLKMLVEKATSIGPTVLEGLLERDDLPQQAKDSIGKAIEKSKTGAQEALKALDTIQETGDKDTGISSEGQPSDQSLSELPALPEQAQRGTRSGAEDGGELSSENRTDSGQGNRQDQETNEGSAPDDSDTGEQREEQGEDQNTERRQR
ncbi:MAG: hypothetical protein HY619_03360 [Thaumarchaeota archaeon]|nr:hypothetical protein [Nitrososphaerota archaeon]